MDGERLMDRVQVMRKMNRHPVISVLVLFMVGYSLHLLYEYGVEWHWPKAALALIVFTGAGIAGWAIDLVFTKNEEEAGEID